MANSAVLGSRPLVPEGSWPRHGPCSVALLGQTRCKPFMPVAPSRNSGEDGGSGGSEGMNTRRTPRASSLSGLKIRRWFD